MSDFAYHNFLQKVVDEDVRFIKEREKLYKGSWARGGGRSSWFMIRRKLDRLIEMMAKPEEPKIPGFSPNPFKTAPHNSDIKIHQIKYLYDCFLSEDIFAKIEQDPSGQDSTVLSEIRDLRRYLILVESFVMAKGVVKEPELENGYKISKLGKLEDEIHPIDAR